MELARRSFRMAVLFGVLATAGVITLGDALGFVGAEAQPTKLAAMEGLWKTESAPMPFNLMAFPSQEKQTNYGQVQVPYVLSILVTHSLTGTVPGVDVLEQRAQDRIRGGIPAVASLRMLSSNPGDAGALSQFNEHQKDLGYGFLVKRYADDVSTATDAQIAQAAKDSIPHVATMFWSFRAMVLLGLGMLAFFVLGLLYTLRNTVQYQRRFLRFAVWMIPAPFLACEAGWLVAELGRQPWTVYGLLPTWMSASTHSVGYMVFSLVGFVAVYTVFIVIEMYLMVRAIRIGPSDGPGPDDGDRDELPLPVSHKTLVEA
jgi:cytochrome d ubiquinol oxidase subunit I